MNIQFPLEELTQELRAAKFVRKEGEWSDWGQGYRVCRSAIETFAITTGSRDRLFQLAQPGLLLGLFESMRPPIPSMGAFGPGKLVRFDRLEFPAPVHAEQCIRMQERCDMATPSPRRVLLEIEHRVQNVDTREWAMLARARWQYDF